MDVMGAGRAVVGPRSFDVPRTDDLEAPSKGAVAPGAPIEPTDDEVFRAGLRGAALGCLVILFVGTGLGLVDGLSFGSAFGLAAFISFFGGAGLGMMGGASAVLVRGADPDTRRSGEDI
jgi:hypothetical protein